MDQNSHFIRKIKKWSESIPYAPAIHYVVKEDLNQRTWAKYTWLQYYNEVLEVANGLMALGFESKSCAAIISSNRPEWLFAQMGIMAAGGISSSVYTTNSANEAAFIVNHSDAQYVFIEDQVQYEKLVQEKANLPKLKKIIYFNPIKNADPKWTISYSDFKKAGQGNKISEVKDRIEKISNDDVAFYIYTSGTTGTPKAVITLNKGLNYMGQAVAKRYPMKKVRLLSYLPLSHIAEQTVTNIVHLEKGGEVYFCSQMENLKNYLSDAKPTVLMGVPRVWEKVELGLKTRFAELSPAQSIMLKVARQLQINPKSPPLIKKIFHNLVLQKIKKKLGLEHLEYAITGSAPTTPSTHEFFKALGIPLLEVYGLSESLGVALSSIPGKICPNSVGFPLEGVEVKIAEDGELLIRSPANTPGYYKDQIATNELWNDGWLHSGDIATKNPDGSFRITDRKKEILVTSGGKNVAPSKIENYLKTIPAISQSIVIGDQRPYLVALLTLNPVVTLSKQQVYNDLLLQIDQVNKLLPRDETIKKFAILDQQFSVETGELTPTQKIKRKVVYGKFLKEINELYS